MSVWSRLARAFGLVRPVDPSRSLGYIPVGWVPSGLRVSTDEAANLSVVWACIQAISTAIASSPWNVFEVEGRTRNVLPDDPLAFILNQRANAETTAVAFREALMFGALAHGNAYAEIQRDMAGRVVGLVPLFPDRMAVERSEAGELVYVYKNWDGGDVRLRPDQVFHLRGPVSVSGLMGDSVITRATKAVALAAAAERFSLAYLANGTITSGVLTYPNKLDDKSLGRIRDQWAEKMTGPKAGGKPVILEGGMKFESISADPDRAQLIPTQQWTVENIARYFGVPLVKLGVAAAAQGYGTNLESLNLEWKNSGLRPWCLRLEQEANAKLLSRRPYRETTIDMEWMVRGDAKSQAEADRMRIESGVYSVNEVRERIGANSIGPEGDLRFINSALTPLTTTLLEIQEMAAKEPDPAPGFGATSEDDTEDTGAGSDDSPEDAPVVRQALRMTFAQNFARMEKRLASKASELSRQKVPNRKRDELLAAYEKRIREELVEECIPHLDLIRKFAASQGRHLNGEADTALLDAIEQLGKGKVADRAADGLVRALLPEANG